jgi:N-methylhydantoinase A/oxoprolinase/acetone carboxylase beta subunit
MIRGIKAVSTERGRDPREFALFAFGGNGPLFACGMAQALGMKQVVVPPCAGLFSSFGLLYADVEHHYSRTLRRLLREADLSEVQRVWDALADQAISQLAVEGFTATRVRLRRSAALHYHGQSYSSYRWACLRERSIKRWSSTSKTHLARSTKKPMATVPASKNRSSWYRSRSLARACARALAFPSKYARAGLSPHRHRHAKPTSGRHTDGWKPQS